MHPVQGQGFVASDSAFVQPPPSESKSGSVTSSLKDLPLVPPTIIIDDDPSTLSFAETVKPYDTANHLDSHHQKMTRLQIESIVTQNKNEIDQSGANILFSREINTSRNNLIPEEKTPRKLNATRPKSYSENKGAEAFYNSAPELSVPTSNVKTPANNVNTTLKAGHHSHHHNKVPRVDLNKLTSNDDGRKSTRRTKSVSNNKGENSDILVNSDSQLSFRDPLLTTRRERKLDQLDDRISIKSIESLTTATDKKVEKSFDKEAKKFIFSEFGEWRKRNLIHAECNDTILSNIADNFMKGEISVLTESKRYIPAEAWSVSNTPRTEQLVEIIQNTLIPISPIFNRLKAIHSILCDYMLDYKTQNQQKIKTLFTETLLGKLQKLIELDDLSNNKDVPLVRGKHLGKFLWVQQKPKGKGHVEPDKEHEKNDLNKKITNIIALAFGDTELIRNKVFNVLEEWNNSSVKVETLKKNVKKWTIESIDQQNVCIIEHKWDEAVNFDEFPILHQGSSELQLKPLNKIMVFDVLRSYIFVGVVIPKLIIINQEIIYDATKKEPIISEEAFLLKIFTSLYKAFGFEIHDGTKKDKLSLRGQVDMMTHSNAKHNLGNSTPEINYCLQVLALSSHKSWERAEHYFNLRFEKLLGKDSLYTVDVQNNFICNICINKVEDYHVEQIRTCILLSQETKEEKMVFPLSWKVRSPVNLSWRCGLRIPNFSLKENVERDEAKVIIKNLIDFSTNSTIKIKLPEKVVSVSYAFRHAKSKNEETKLKNKTKVSPRANNNNNNTNNNNNNNSRNI